MYVCIIRKVDRGSKEKVPIWKGTGIPKLEYIRVIPGGKGIWPDPLVWGKKAGKQSGRMQAGAVWGPSATAALWFPGSQ